MYDVGVWVGGKELVCGVFFDCYFFSEIGSKVKGIS